MPRRSISPLPSDPLEQARRFASDAKDIARDERRRLPEYDADTDETTVTGAQQHVHVHMHSQPDTDSQPTVELGPVKLRGLPKWALVGVGLVLAGVTALASRFLAK